MSYTNKNFPNNLGKVDEIKRYPISFQESESYFNIFLTDRFLEFGDYEDAILKESSSLHHSLLSPLMNVGLLMPLNIVKKAVIFAEKTMFQSTRQKVLFDKLLGGENLFVECTNVKVHIQEQEIFGLLSEKFH